MSEYVPVPVDAAREIAQRYQKQVIVIVSEDLIHCQIHTTTYGVEATDKIRAAELGPVLAAAAGAFVPNSAHFEDFRDSAQAAERYDKLLADLKTAHRLLGDASRAFRGEINGAETADAIAKFLGSEVAA